MWVRMEGGWDDDGAEVEVETIKSGDKDNTSVH